MASKPGCWRKSSNVSYPTQFPPGTLEANSAAFPGVRRITATSSLPLHFQNAGPDFFWQTSPSYRGKGHGKSKTVRTEGRIKYRSNIETRDKRNATQHLLLTPTIPHRTGLVEVMASNDKLLIQSLRVSEVEGNENTRPMNQQERRMKEGRLLAVGIILEIISRLLACLERDDARRRSTTTHSQLSLSKRRT